jgi:hypothetical protein
MHSTSYDAKVRTDDVDGRTEPIKYVMLKHESMMLKVRTGDTQSAK